MDLLYQTVEEYKQAWKHATEVTSSSPSGIHFGNYIAGIFNLDILFSMP